MKTKTLGRVSRQRTLWRCTLCGRLWYGLIRSQRKLIPSCPDLRCRSLSVSTVQPES